MKTIRAFACEPCGRAYKNQKALEQHQQDSPAHADSLNCNTCARTFKSAEALESHLQHASAHINVPGRDTRDQPSNGTGTAHRRSLNRPPGHKQGIWSLHPSLHQDVLQLVEDDDLCFDFHDTKELGDCIRDYDTNISGQFDCSDEACPTRKWSSRKIAITIQLYPNDRYNAAVWHQRCRSCNNLGQPILDDTYAERVAYRLKKWYGIKVEAPPYSKKKRLEGHESELCEGCKNGHCRETLDNF